MIKLFLQITPCEIKFGLETAFSFFCEVLGYTRNRMSRKIIEKLEKKSKTTNKKHGWIWFDAL